MSRASQCPIREVSRVTEVMTRFRIVVSGSLIVALALVGGAATAPRCAAMEAQLAPGAQSTLTPPNPITPDMQPKVRELVESARAAVLKEPNSARAWGGLGAACDAHKLFKCAETCYRRAYEIRPSDFAYPYLLAIVLDTSGAGGAESVALYKRAAELRSDYPPILWRLGVALNRQGNVDEALEVFLRSTEQGMPFAMGDRSAGQALLARGETNRAILHLERASRLTPKDGAVFASLAQAYRRAGQPDRAQKAAETSRGLEPVYDVPDPLRAQIRALAGDSVTIYSRAKALVNAGRFAEAIPDLKSSAEADPDDSFVHVYLATCYRATAQLELARTHATRAIKLKGDNLSAHLELSAVEIQLGRLAEGMRFYQRALEIEPGNAGVPMWVGDVLIQQGHLDEGIAAFERAKTLGTLSARAHWTWGVALTEKNDQDGAMLQYNEALRLDPKFANAHYSIGMIFEERGRRDEAMESYRKAIAIDPNHIAGGRLTALQVQTP